MKACFKCHRSLPYSQFYRHAAMGDGYLGKCKDCTRDDVTEHRIRNIGRIREYDRKRADEPHRVALRKRIVAEDRARHPERYKARVAVSNAIRDGRLVRPTGCSNCGVSGPRIEAHHADYGKPLDVEWLCKPCHYRADQERRAA